jgi:hypothetical protein
MRVSVRCGAARPVQLRGAAKPVPTPARVAPAARCSQLFGRRARLDQGCAARLVAAAAAEGEPEPAPPRSASEGEAEPQKRRRKRAPNVGEYGETTADGKPEPDERTVEDLVVRGWFESEEDAVALLTRMKSRKERFLYETAKPAADWLEATLGPEPLKGGVLPAAKVVQRFPDLLRQDAATLQRKWVALTLPTEQGGVGIAFSEVQAREAVLKRPRVLGYSTDTLKRGWLMLTATEGGLGLSPEEARRLILQHAQVLTSDAINFTKRVELLRSLGYPKAHEMVLTEPRVLNFKEETVREHDAWWKQTGLDHIKIVESQPPLLGAPTTVALQANLDFLRLTGMSTADLNNASSLFGRSLDGRLRARYFYALLKGRLGRYSINSMMQVKDSTFLAMMQGRPMATKELASELEVARYDKLVKSAKFAAWRERQEALRMLNCAQPRVRSD